MKKRHGFTLLELTISMALISMIMAGVFMAFGVMMKIFVGETDQTDILIDADRSMSIITRELREAVSIVSASTREVVFWAADKNANGSREASETESFIWSGTSGTSLNRVVSPETRPIAYNVKAFSLTYDNPSDIKLINISLTLKKNDSMTTIESSVKLRNI